MNSPFSKKPVSQKKPQQFAGDSILESLRDIGSGVSNTVVKDVAGGMAQDAISSIFGGPPKSPSSEIRPNQSVEIGGRTWETPTAKPKNEINTGLMRSQDQMRVAQEIQAVREELRALADSLQAVSVEIENTIAQTPVDPGVYHVSFFERLKSLLREARMDLEDSRTWNALSSGRKRKKGYWGMYKKHGTKFGLSSERTAATQVG